MSRARVASGVVDAGAPVQLGAGKGGLGAAYLAGFAWALREGYDVVGEMDADGSGRLDLHELKHAPPQVRHERCSDIKFSPDGRFIAVGNADNFIDLYTCPGSRHAPGPKPSLRRGASRAFPQVSQLLAVTTACLPLGCLT